MTKSIITKLLDNYRKFRNYGLQESFIRFYALARRKLNNRVDIVNYDYNPYDFIDPLKNINIEIQKKNYYKERKKMHNFSLVTTILNESKSIDRFLGSITSQSLKPSEIIIVDGGSQDGTCEKINEYSRKFKNLKIKLIVKPGINISQGRNIGIKIAKKEVIVLVDAGCVLDRNFCLNIVGPMFNDPSVDLSGGIYYSLENSNFSKVFIPNWRKLDWSKFLPSARGMAVKRKLAIKSPYPEYLMTGEDTLFDINYRRVSSKWVFNKSAIVLWSGPKSHFEMNKLIRRYYKGDGESGMAAYLPFNMGIYEKNKYILKFLPISLVCNSNEFLINAYKGYIEGRQERSKIEIEKRKVNGLIFIFSGVPITDIGGGQRASQIAFEFIKKNYKVVFINIYPSFEEKKDKLYFDIDFTLLDLWHINDFHPKDIFDVYSYYKDNILIISEFPHGAFFNKLNELKKLFPNAKYIYDYIDKWDTTLGTGWYDATIDKLLLDQADFIIATANLLAKEIKNKSGKEVYLIPNAVNLDLFNLNYKYIRPRDLPSGKYFLYFGSLYGDWFDWETMEFVVKSMNKYNFVFIGDHGKMQYIKFSKNYKNCFFLGKKAQKDLPAYLNFAHKCFIPFKKESNVTQYVNPLKVYEYLSMNKSVIATEMFELRDIPGVYIAKDKLDFIKLLNKDKPFPFSEVNSFLDNNNWRVRVEKIIKISSKKI